MAQHQQGHWPCQSPVFGPGSLKSFINSSIEPELSTVSVKDIIKKSASFPIKFPIESVRCKYLQTKDVPNEILERNINSVYPILHESALPLFLEFLDQKKRFGSDIERKLYQDFTIEHLIDRLLKKRAIVFCGRLDTFMLLDGFSDEGKWEIIGTSEEKSPRTLKNCLSYDEIKLSALLSVSSYTHFINDGARHNSGKYSLNREGLEDFGVIIGLIGPRLTKPYVMEYRDVLVTRAQNSPDKGYGESFVPTIQGVFANYYGEPNMTYEEWEPQFTDKSKFIKFSNGYYFHNLIYEKRLSLSIDTLLLEANARGKELNKMAFVHVVGIGLGVWKISSHQDKLFMDVFCKRIQFLGANLNYISDICFSYIGADSCGEYKDQETMPINEGIKIHIGNSNPHTKLVGRDEGKLRVVSYAWDGNALPGNEFWLGSLTSSSDPAAACSTQVAELHNPHINPKVSAANLKIATLNGIIPFREYVEKIHSV